MTTESNMWKWLKKASSSEIYMERIENLASPGFADVFGYSKTHGAFFIELKQCPKPKRLNSKLTFDIRKSQVIWHRKMSSIGANTWLLMKIGRENYLLPGNFINPSLCLTLNNKDLINVSKLSPTELINFVLKYKSDTSE